MTTFEKRDGGFQFLEEGDVLTPPETDRFLRLLNNELATAGLAYREARRVELDRFKDYSDARKPHELHPDCPEVGRGAGQVTAKAEEAWFERRIPDPYWAWKNAVLERQNAGAYMSQVGKQVEIMRSLNKNATDHFGTYRGGGR
ncbi:hypothetical protein [Nonomuraea guangzhouensis]|uniref:Uncharacterized protein n=1 Tax=Nonomuraea guangzhouensis TaxID=1291555 RepID=A0ABW4GVP0_9ACTN|nr:hypothetical protein [Nonomuraea guangzhouensis]